MRDIDMVAATMRRIHDSGAGLLTGFKHARTPLPGWQEAPRSTDRQ